MADKDMEKKADALLDEEQSGKQESEDKTEEQKEITDPGKVLRQICRGKLKLLHPFRAHGQDVTEVPFDFCDLTGTEMMDALDEIVTVNNMYGISNKQALALFAATAGKCAPMVEDGSTHTRLFDAKDVKARLGAADAVKAIQLAKLFYQASSQAGNNNISKD